MSKPTMTCAHCGASRDCLQHTRAEHPPSAAKAFLRKHCPKKTDDTKTRPCHFVYRPGGTRKIADIPSPCAHPQHNPPLHMVYEPGVWQHVCPGCWASQTFTVTGATL